jgi:hypothetical protein
MEAVWRRPEGGGERGSGGGQGLAAGWGVATAEAGGRLREGGS